MATSISPYQGDVEQMIKDFYGIVNGNPPRIEINDKVADVFTTMLLEAQKCTKGFVLIPHPPSGPASISWLVYNLSRSAIQEASGY